MKRFNRAALTALMGTTALAASQGAFAQAIDTSSVTDEIVVRGVNIPDEKRATSEISSVLDEVSFQRTGDADIAAALARVSGLSVADGKFVIVRGLNERYSSVTINGSPLPSPEPLRRVVPLDLIPTSFLSGSLVQKTYSPQFSAEFGGGLVELRTKSVPDEFYLNIGLSAGLDTVTTGQQGLTHDGGELDFLGFDDGTRSVPGLVRDAFFGFDGINTPADQNALEASLASPETSVIFEETIPPNYNVSLDFGGFKDLTDTVTFGANFAFNFGNDFQTREGRREQGLSVTAAGVDQDPLDGDFTGLGNNADLFDFRSTTQTAKLNGLATFGLQIGDNHEITSTSFILRSTLKDTRISQGVNLEEDDTEIFQENFEFFERQVWQTQLAGEHVFPNLLDLEVSWRGAYGEAFRDAPFQRQIRRARDEAGQPFLLPFAPSVNFGSLTNSSNRLTFSEVNDQNIDAGIDFILPLTFQDNDLDIKFGYAYTDKERDTFVRNFLYDSGPDGFPDALAGIRNDVLFSESVAGSDFLELELVTNPISLDNAFSTLQVHAAYFGLDAPLGDYVRVAAGVRYESGEQVTEAFPTQFGQSVVGQPGFEAAVIDEDYFLPSATVTWNPVGDLQLRLGYSQTITRPQFRELTPAIFIDDDTDQQVVGNPFLVNTEVDNFDARLEYYFARGQFVTIGGFYKDLENPIETSSLVIGGENFQTFLNAPSAELYGLEFEYERIFALEDVFDGAWFQGRDLVFKTNYTWSQSDVSADGQTTAATVNTLTGAVPNTQDAANFIIDGRSLQGQSDHLVNLQVGVENADTNSKATLLVNWASARIRQTEDLSSFGGAAAVASGNFSRAVIERPPVLVDFVYSRDIEDMFGLGGVTEIGFSVRNILGEDYEATQSFDDGTTAEFDVYDLGRTISASIKRRF